MVATVVAQVKPGIEAPRFKVDPAWPKIPNNWQFGQVASVSIDAQDHVWVLQRPGTLSPEEKGRAAPPVLEFDAAGNFIQAWGGPGQGYEWPNSEHGVYIDPKGFVWIGGNGEKDHQILKFTKAGKFVMQIGRAGQSKGNADTQNLNQPADAFVYAKTNELIVADGYGNRRVIVFDADTGKFKRMWGAFGNVPTDAPPNPAPPDADPRGAPQFVQPVHAARVSNDGMVYVSDRGGKRVQVFTLDGKVREPGFHRTRVQGPGMRKRNDCSEHGVLSRRRSAVPLRRQPQPGQGDDLRPQDARARGFLWPVGIGAGRFRNPSSHGGRFEGQSLRDRGHSPQT